MNVTDTQLAAARGLFRGETPMSRAALPILLRVSRIVIVWKTRLRLLLFFVSLVLTLNLAINLQPDQQPERWDNHVAVYEEVFEPLTSAFARRALDRLGPCHGDRLIDDGAGIGLLRSLPLPAAPPFSPLMRRPEW